MRLAILHLSLILNFAVIGCTTPPATRADLVPSFEVLAVPSGQNIYRPGTTWIRGVGPEGAPHGSILTDSGVDHLRSHIGNGFEAEVSAVFEGIVATAFGIQNADIADLSLRGLSHQRVESLYDAALGNLVLLETITADSIEFTVNTGIQTRSSSEIAEALSSSVSDVGVEISGTGESAYAIRASQPLVVAIRIAKVDYSQRTAQSVIGDIDSDAAFGYRFTEISPPDIDNRTVTIGITNPDLIQFPGMTATLRPGQPLINKLRREAIGDSDYMARQSDFVWDQFLLVWGTPRRIQVTRQYLSLSKGDSGL